MSTGITALVRSASPQPASRVHLVGAGRVSTSTSLAPTWHTGAGGSGVGIGRGDDLVSGADAQDAQGHLQAGGGGVEAHGPVCSRRRRPLPLKFPWSWVRWAIQPERGPDKPLEFPPP